MKVNLESAGFKVDIVTNGNMDNVNELSTGIQVVLATNMKVYINVDNEITL